jgi:FkbM family methyltransferase
MVNRILRGMRNITPLNRAIRSVISSITNGVTYLSNHWRVAGSVNLKFNDIPFKLISLGDDPLADTLFYKRPYIETPDVLLFTQLAKRSSVVFDIGANTGLYTILSSRSNPNVKIFSFEPNPNNFHRLQDNIKVNELTNAKPFQLAVGSGEGAISFFVPRTQFISDTSSAVRQFSEKTYGGKLKWNEITVRQTSLDNFCAQEKVADLNLLKIDVEGYEMEVFKGAQITFEKFRPIILCEIFPDEERVRYFRDFSVKHGYMLLLVLHDGLVNIGTELIENPGGLNYLFVPFALEERFISYEKFGGIMDKHLVKHG